MTRLAILLLFAQSLTAFAGTYYISTSGSDAAAGTSKATAWAHHPRMRGFTGNYVHAAGDHFVFKGGDTWAVACFPWTITQGGISGTLDVYTVDVTWFTGGSFTRPIFDGGSTVLGNGIAGSQVYVTASYVTFDNLEFANHRSDKGNPSYGNMTIALYGQITTFTLTNCVVRDWSMAAPISSGDDNNGTGGIQYFYGGGAYLANSSVTHCTFYQHGVGTNYTGVAVRNIPMDNTEIYDVCNAYLGGGSIHDNHIHDIKHWADPLTHCNAIEVFSPSTIYNNVIHGLEPLGTVSPLNMIPDTSSPGLCLVYNNIFYDLATQSVYPDHTGTPGGNQFKFYNNVIQHDTICIRMTLRNNGVYGLLDARNNLFICPNTSTPVGYNNPAAGYANVTSATVSDNITMTPAQAAAYGYAAPTWAPLDATKPTVTASGVNFSSVFTTDILGAVRPGVGVWQVGPYQFTAPTGAGTITLDVPSQSVLESAGSVTVTAKRTGGSTGAVGCTRSTADGTALDGVNYTGSIGTFSWANGDTANKAFSIPILNASTYGNKDFSFVLSSATGGASLGTPTANTITIQGVGAAPVTILPWPATWLATDGEIGAPLVSTGGYVTNQTETVNPATAGTAIYRFTNGTPCQVAVDVTVNGPNDAANSLFVNVNALPTSPTMIWDINPVTSGDELRTVDWRGTGSADSDEIRPKYFDLVVGTNYLCIAGREAGVSFTNVTVRVISAATNPPAATVVASSAMSGYYKAGASVPVTIAFSTNVFVTGTPQLTNNAGAVMAYASGSGTATLTFAYTVAPGQTSAALDYVATNSLALPGGATIKDALGTSADLTLPAPGAPGSVSYGQSIVIDTTAPTVTISAPSTSYTSPGGTASWSVTYGGPNFSVSTLADSDITLSTTGTATGTVIVAPGNPSAIQVVSVINITGRGTIAISLAAGTGIDLAGNLAPAAGPSASVSVLNSVHATTINAGKVKVRP